MIFIKLIDNSNIDLSREVIQLLFDVCSIIGDTTLVKMLFKQSMFFSLESCDTIKSLLEYELYFFKVFNKSLKVKCQKEVFEFCSDENSGLYLDEIKFPNEGYGFFGWIKMDSIDLPTDTKSTIWCFVIPNRFLIDLSIIKCRLVYTIEDFTNPSSKRMVVSNENLLPDTWYFLEMYHINSNSPENLVLNYIIDRFYI